MWRINVFINRCAKYQDLLLFASVSDTVTARNTCIIYDEMKSRLCAWNHALLHHKQATIFRLTSYLLLCNVL